MSNTYANTAKRIARAAALLELRMRHDVQGAHALIAMYADDGVLEEITAALVDVSVEAIAKDAEAALERGEDSLPSTMWIAGVAAAAREQAEAAEPDESSGAEG